MITQDEETDLASVSWVVGLADDRPSLDLGMTDDPLIHAIRYSLCVVKIARAVASRTPSRAYRRSRPLALGPPLRGAVPNGGLRGAVGVIVRALPA
jgi:hypothetical protein